MKYIFAPIKQLKLSNISNLALFLEACSQTIHVKSEKMETVICKSFNL